jgi:hypothetical protein
VPHSSHVISSPSPSVTRNSRTTVRTARLTCGGDTKTGAFEEVCHVTGTQAQMGREPTTPAELDCVCSYLVSVDAVAQEGGGIGEQLPPPLQVPI